MPRETKEQKEAREREEKANLEAMTVLVADPLEVIRPYLVQVGMEESEVMFYLYRVVDSGKQVDAFLFKCKPEDYDPEELGRTYGSGVYRIKLYVKDNDHPNGVVRAAPKFAIEMPPGYKPGAVEVPAQVVAVQSERQPSLAEIVAAVAAAMPKPVPGPTMTEMLTQMEIMSRIMRPAESARPAGGDAFSSVKEALGLIESVKKHIPKAEGGEGESITSTIREGIGLVSEVMRNNRAQHGPQAPQAQLPPPGEVLPNPAAPVNAGAPVETAEDDETMMTGIYIKMAIGAAKKNAPVESMAALVVEHIGDDLLEAIIEGKTPEGEDWFSILEKLNPDVTPHRVWFESLRAKVIEYCQPEDAPAQENQSGGVEGNFST